MAVLDVLNLNLGTEQNPNWVAHELHDKRISTTAVTTATHLLATNAGVTAMNPITAANLASVLGVGLKRYGFISSTTDIDKLGAGIYDGIGWHLGDSTTAGYLLCFVNSNAYRFQIALIYASNFNEIKHRCYNSTYGWSSWK